MKVPLFPLRTVLFPDGVLPLRIFEARYMDMVRERMRARAEFGVFLIANGDEVGAPATFEPVGCLASIGAWDMQQLGVLQIRVHGIRRCRVARHETQPDGLLVGEVEAIEPDVDYPLAPAHQPCADLLRRVIDDQSRAHPSPLVAASSAQADLLAPFEPPYRFESSVWVGNRLCEVLSIPARARQKLMELDDAGVRLDLLTQYLRQHGVVA